MKNFFRPALIVGSLPNTIANGQTADAVPLMADLNWIVNQVNANAAPLANVALTNANNSFTQPQGGVSAQTVSQFVLAGDIITGGYQTLTSALGTNTITARSTQIIPSSAQAGQAVFLIPAQTNTGPVTLNRDSLGSIAVLQMGSALMGGEFQKGIPSRLFLDGSNYHIVGPFNGGKIAAPVQAVAFANNNFVMIGPNIFGGAGILQIVGGAAGWSINNQANNAINLQGNDTGAIAIKFAPTQVPSADVNTLDDYEEGTWTPSVGGSATYTTQSGTYTKIGNRVFFDGILVINAIGTGSTTQISGLPFACAASTGVGINQSNTGASAASSIVSMTAVLPSGSTTITIRSRTAASAADGSNAIFQNATAIIVFGQYSN